jgi:hypothetical protein
MQLRKARNYNGSAKLQVSTIAYHDRIKERVSHNEVERIRF